MSKTNEQTPANSADETTLNPNSHQGMEARVRQAVARLFSPEIAKVAELENLGGHASLRIYWRVTLPATDLDTGQLLDPARGEFTRMAMVLPMSGDPFASDEGTSEGDAAITELPFINMQRYLRKIDLPVGDIDRVDMDLGVLLLEDLGQQTFEDRILAVGGDEDAFMGLYREAIDLLIDFQLAVLNSAGDRALTEDCIGFGRKFDRGLLRWELDHYLEWGLDARLSGDEAARVDARRADLSAAFDTIVDALLAAPQTLVLRDYQSRNLMYKDGWQLIDFQDALMGSCVYDLVALLRDSYIELRGDQVDALLGYYSAQGARAELPWCADEDAVVSTFHLQTVQRKLKDAGRFINIDRVKGDPSFLPYYDASIRYVFEALSKCSVGEELSEILADIEPSWPRG